ncbi:MAG: tandem-95 repeat protein, partial [Kangiellaceae bacterium]|nr:tandem-95 repeat protein [Kangiellaceae bacterium]
AISVSDPAGLTTDLAAFSITVINVNEAPIAVDDTASTDEDNAVTIDVLANDTDNDVGDTLSVIAIAGAVNGTATISGDQVVFTPDADFNGSGAFNYTVNDGTVSASANVSVTVNTVNDSPTISGTPTGSVAQDTLYTFTPTATDVDGDPLSFTASNLPSWLALDTDNGNISGTPTNAEVGTYANIQLSVNSAGGLNDSLTAFSITVTNTNDAPVATDDNATTDEDSGVLIDVLANDTDSDVDDLLSITVVSNVTNGSAIITEGQIRFTPNADFNGVGSLSYTMSDGVLTATANVTITVNAINDAPEIGGTPASSVVQDNLYSFTPTASDVDGDSLTFSVLNAPSWTTFNTGDGTLSGTPTNANLGVFGNIQISVSSNGDLSDFLPAFTITVDNSNDAPTAVDDSATTDEDVAITIDVLNNDIDVDIDDTLVITAVNTVTNGAAEIINNQVSFTPSVNFNGTGSFSYIVSDGTVTDTASVSITVNAVNDAPTISGSPATSIAQDDGYSFTPTANDVDGDALSFSIINSPSWATFNTANGTLTGTPTNDDVGSYANIQITAHDSSESTPLTTFAITVTDVNDSPIALDDDVTTNEDTSVVISVLINDTDADGDQITVISAVANNGGVEINNNGVLSYSPNTDFNGFDTINYTIEDGNGGSDTAKVNVTVTAINDAPSSVDDDVTTLEGQPITINVLSNDSDPDIGDTLTVTSAGTNTGTVTVNPDSSLNYMPELNFLGDVEVSYAVSDSNGGIAAAKVIVQVRPVAISINATPAFEVLEENEYLLEPQVTASPNVSYSYSITNLPSWAVFDVNTGVLVGTPVRADEGLFGPISLCVDDSYNTACLTDFSIEVKGDLDHDGVADDVDDDIDGDGMSNDFENLYGLDPFDASDADLDSDGDGLSNLEEFIAGSNPTEDDNPPELVTPNDIIIDATEYLNTVNLGTAEAFDYVAGVRETCCTVTNNSPERFIPGTTEVIWIAEDAAGNITEFIQLVQIDPIVSFGANRAFAEGETAKLVLFLNGDAPTYPYSIGFSVSGGTAIAGEDYISPTETAVFENGTSVEIPFEILSDTLDEGNETIVFTIHSGENRGEKFEFEVIISEDNIAPLVQLSAEQNGAKVIEFGVGLGTVIISSSVEDSNSSDTFNYDWSATDNRLSDSDSEEGTFSFDPTGLANGHYRIELTVTDSANEPLSGNAILDLLLVNNPNNDDLGLPCNFTPHKKTVTNGFLLETSAGTCINRSIYSSLSEDGGVLLSPQDFSNQSDLVDDTHITTGGRFNFNVQKLAHVSEQVAIVISLREAIPSDPLYRLLENGSWRDFSQANGDQLFSANGDIGYCPPPGHSRYQDGITTGHVCVMLLITEGGANDTDSVANGILESTGGVHEEFIPPPPPPPPTPPQSNSGGGGGGSLGWLLLLFGSLRIRFKPTRHKVL